VARIVYRGDPWIVWMEEPKKIFCLEVLGIDGRRILKWIIEKWDGAWFGLI
jgi:hypothetical protein